MGDIPPFISAVKEASSGHKLNFLSAACWLCLCNTKNKHNGPIFLVEVVKKPEFLMCVSGNAYNLRLFGCKSGLMDANMQWEVWKF